MRPLGKRQIDLLAKLGSPGMFLIVGDPVSRSLAKRGLLKPEGTSTDDDSFYHITSAGLRALADAMDSGQIKPSKFLDEMRKKER